MLSSGRPENEAWPLGQISISKKKLGHKQGQVS
jgi:hypothetical protein